MKDMNIGKKLALGFALVLFLMVIDAITGIISLNKVTNNYQVEVKTESDIRIKTEEIEGYLTQARRYEKLFYNEKDEKYLQSAYDYLNKATKGITEVKSESKHSEVLTQVNEIEKDINNFNQNLDEFYNEIKEKGLTDNQGLQLKFKTATNDLDQQITQLNKNNWLLLDYLVLRGYEKDYLISGSKDNLSKADALIGKMYKKITASGYNSTLKNDLTDILQNYKKYLHELIEKDDEINVNLTRIDKDGDEILTLAGDITDEQGSYLEELETEIAGSADIAETVLWIGAVLALIIGILISRYLTKGITGPLSEITSAAKSLANGDLNHEINIYQNDEVGQVADAFRDIILSLEKMQNTLQKTISEQKNGEIDDRCEIDIVSGVYRELLVGINESLDALVSPIYGAIEILKDYSQGDLERKMKALPGKQAIFTETLNTVRENLLSLIDEGVSLSRAAENGNLKIRGDIKKFKGGYLEIINGMNTTIDNIVAPINEAVSCLQNIEQGDLTVKITGDYKGDHAIIKEALNNTVFALNDILSQVAIAVEQVSSGAQQVADSSAAVSQGATEQASSLEETSSSMLEINTQSKQNSENAEKADKLATESGNKAENGNKQMGQMLEAMGAISDSSTQISKIIKVIDEIAFQTNLLSLNAAVEAARAGIHGKGFAVVAEEVRNLAQRSAKAAKETTELIENATERINAGSGITNETAKALEEIIGTISQVSELINDISNSSREQVGGIEQINQALQQIDQVTQSSTANAEESASAAEELSSQAVQLSQVISKFKLSNNQTYISNDTRSFGEDNQKKDQSLLLKDKKSAKKPNGKAKKANITNLDDDDFSDF